jgi:hypothetical protein
MARTAWYPCLPVIVSVVFVGACGNDPYAGESESTSTQTSTGTGSGGSAGAQDGGVPDVPELDDASLPPAPDGPLVSSTTSQAYVALAPVKQLDLVVMLDNSPSMAPKRAKFAAQFPRLIQALSDPSDHSLPDLRIAIVDSDLGTGCAYSAGPCGPSSSNQQSCYGDMGRFQMVGASDCGVTDANAQWLEYKGGAAVNYAGNISEVFSCLAGNLSLQGCGMEHQLQAYEFALAVNGIGNDAQHVFLRPQAYLGLVFLTDEDDCSAATNDGMFGDKAELRGESASLRCATRAHACGGRNLADSPPGYPTTASFAADIATCVARTDACPNPTDSTVAQPFDTSEPTSCSPLKDVHHLAAEIKALKSNPDEQILVAGIFGMPIPGQNLPYKIDLIPNPNTADTAHPQVYDLWPICYDPDHFSPSDVATYNATDVGWGAMPGLRASAFVDEFGPGGLKFSICEADYTQAMKGIGESMVGKLSNVCLDQKLVDMDATTPGLQPSCEVHLQYPVPDPADASKTVMIEQVDAIPRCPVASGDVAQDCWQLATDTARCPATGQVFTLLRPAAEIARGPLEPGTRLRVACQVCTAGYTAGCDY